MHPGSLFSSSWPTLSFLFIGYQRLQVLEKRWKPQYPIRSHQHKYPEAASGPFLVPLKQAWQTPLLSHPAFFSLPSCTNTNMFSLSSKFPDELLAMKLTSGTWKIFLSTLLQHDWCLPPPSSPSKFTSPLLDHGVSLQFRRNGKEQCSWLLWIWWERGRKDSYWWCTG